MATKTFTSGEVLTAADTNTYLANSGLVYVSSTTVGTAVSSVTVSSAFSSTYDNYRIIYSNGSQTNADFLLLTLNNATGSSYAWGAMFYQYSASFTYTANGGATSSRVGVMGGRAQFIIDICSPNLTGVTTFTTQNSSDSYSWNGGGYNSVSAQHTGFTLTAAAGTMTGGTITVYGYRKA